MFPNRTIAAICLSACSISPVLSKRSPNVIFILADDLGYGELGCYGQTKIETPNIDELASRGMLFSQYYAGAPVSAPSSSVLFTGKHTGHTYIRGNDEMGERGNVGSHQAMFENPFLEGQRPLPSSTIILPQLFKQREYKTACIGKWGLGYPGSGSTPNDMGFDFFYGYNCQRQSHTYYPPFLYRNKERVYLDNENIIQPGTKLGQSADPFDESSYRKFIQNEYSPNLMFDELISFVEQNKNDPFFLMWTTPAPHVPLQAPQKWIDYYRDKFGDEIPYLGESGYFPVRYPRATYAAMVSYFDEQVGFLIQYLKENNIFDGTLIIFTSDNGPTFNGGTDSPWFQSAGPFKSEYSWGKASLHEGGIRVPFIASWPERIKSNMVSNHIAAAWDVMATFADVLDIEVDSDGISFLPELTGGEQFEEHDYLYWEFSENGGSMAVLLDGWKGIIENINGGNDVMRLYNLNADPREIFDQSIQYPKIIEKMKEIIKKSHRVSEVERFRFPFDK